MVCAYIVVVVRMTLLACAPYRKERCLNFSFYDRKDTLSFFFSAIEIYQAENDYVCESGCIVIADKNVMYQCKGCFAKALLWHSTPFYIARSGQKSRSLPKEELFGRLDFLAVFDVWWLAIRAGRQKACEF